MERCDFLTFTVQSRMDDEAETPPDYPPQGSDGVTKLYSFKYTVATKNYWRLLFVTVIFVKSIVTKGNKKKTYKERER